MNWTSDQKKIIDARNSNLLVSAAAGSGKTAVLVERIIRMVSDKENPIDIDELLVVTFTKAAAAQMKDKIAAAMESLLLEQPDRVRTPAAAMTLIIEIKVLRFIVKILS